jgi:hypothetical protein
MIPVSNGWMARATAKSAVATQVARFDALGFPFPNDRRTAAGVVLTGTRPATMKSGVAQLGGTAAAVSSQRRTRRTALPWASDDSAPLELAAATPARIA